MNKEPPNGGGSRLDVRIQEKRYPTADGRDIVALKGTAFGVEYGSFTCLIGPSGCGKTTLLRILLGLEPDYEGSVTLPSGPTAIGAVFQEPQLLPWRTVEENLRLALPRGQESVSLDPLLAELDLSDMRSRYPGELSLGLARRAALARALAIEPQILLLDEPFVSLDQTMAQRLRGILLQLWQAHALTVLMVTHNLREAIQLADHLILLSPRPAHVVGEVTLDRPRGGRSESEAASLLAELARRYPGTIEV
ncbi:MAG: ABC transporter ATP-binding protein [Kiloniellales bacterium]